MITASSNVVSNHNTDAQNLELVKAIPSAFDSLSFPMIIFYQLTRHSLLIVHHFEKKKKKKGGGGGGVALIGVWVVQVVYSKEKL